MKTYSPTHSEFDSIVTPNKSQGNSLATLGGTGKGSSITGLHHIHVSKGRGVGETTTPEINLRIS